MDNRKINYYKWCVLDGRWQYVASTAAFNTLWFAALHLPSFNESGALVMKPWNCNVQPLRNFTKTKNHWLLKYEGSTKHFDACDLAQKAFKYLAEGAA
jgi:hypothetical protein